MAKTCVHCEAIFEVDECEIVIHHETECVITFSICPECGNYEVIDCEEIM